MEMVRPSLHRVRVTQLLNPPEVPPCQRGTLFSSNVAPQRSMKNSISSSSWCSSSKKAEDDENEGPNPRWRADALLLARSKCSLSGL